MLIFGLGRLCFVIYNFQEFKESSWGEILRAFVAGWKVDLAMACYLLVPSLMILIILQMSQKRLFWRLHNAYLNLTLLATSIITMAELPLYREWNHKLTFKALWFLQQPAEVFHTASNNQLVFGLLGIGVFWFTGWWLRQRMLQQPKSFSRPYLHAALTLLLLPFVLLGARGGWSPIPIQISEAYYSTNNTLNAAASNSNFHLMSNILQNLEAVEPYTFMSKAEAQKVVDALYSTERDTTIRFVTHPKPNICLVVFEGWAADMVGALGGFQGVTPNFDKLIQNGVSFDSCYASGNLSDQGMGAVFSAFPAQPRTSIVTIPSKYPALPSLVKPFKDLGYRSSFLFGGQLIYGNIKSYIYHSGFDRVEEEANFPSEVNRGRLGVHDGDAYKRQLSLIGQDGEPFFAAMFTQSTHGPYDIPVNGKFTWGEGMRDYVNAVYYADSVLGEFIDKARQQSWYKNTLFVFVSDHHHNTPKTYSYHSPEYRRIPLVFYGEVIDPAFRGKQYHRVCSQLDLASTLLHQLNMPAQEFVWSQNLMNPYSQEFAFYSFDEGFGWRRPEGQLVYWVRNQKREFEVYRQPNIESRLLREGKAYLQRITEEFDRY